MMRLLLPPLLLLFLKGSVLSQEMDSRVLKSAREVRSLSQAQAETGIPVDVTGIVIFADPPATAFLQDASAGTFFRLQGKPSPATGDRVRVKGQSFPGLFLPGIEETAFEILSSESLPAAIAANYEDLLSGKFHYQRVVFEGIVRKITPEEEGISRVTLARGSRLLEVRVQEAISDETPGVDARVQVTGLAAGHINHRRQLVEPYLRAVGWEEFTVLQPAQPLDEVPFVSPRELLRFDIEGRAENRVKVEGVVLAVFRRHEVFLRTGESAIRIQLLNPEPRLVPGARIEVIGFPEMDQFSASLVDASVLSTASDIAPPTPLSPSLGEIFEGTHDNDLVRVEGTVSDWFPRDKGAVVVLRNGSQSLNVNLPTLSDDLRAGITAAMTGIARVEATVGTEYRSRPEAVSLTLRDADDFVVLGAPQWWTARRLATGLVAFLTATVVAALWIFLLRRQVNRQTNALKMSIQHEAALEERQRLAREFHDTLEQDLAGLSLRLDAASTKVEDDKVRELLTGSRSLVGRVQSETRNLVSDLRETHRGTRDLKEAFSDIHDDLPQQIGPTLIWDLEENINVPARTAHHLKMIAKEGITNALKHAEASTIQVKTSTANDQLQLTVCDDGCGLDTTADTGGKAGHFGCMGIRERARRIGAEVSWNKLSDGGTSLDLTLSHPDD